MTVTNSNGNYKICILNRGDMYHFKGGKNWFLRGNKNLTL